MGLSQDPMALTVVIKLPGEDRRELSLSLDAPRVVVGRSKSCDVVLADPTVSARHASIRLQGGKNLIVDEGSTNGTLVGSVKLPPQTPRAVSDGELVRVGRVWLELRFGACDNSATGSTRDKAKALAMDLLAAQLEAQGERLQPHLEVVTGPDAGARLALSVSDDEYVIGRSSDSDLALSDPMCSRRHVSVQRVGGTWCVRDHGSKRGTELDGVTLGREPRAWRDGTELQLGDSILILRNPLAEAYEEALALSDVKMRASELAEPPPGSELPEEPLLVVEAPDEGSELDDETPSESLPVVAAPLVAPSRGAGFVDAMVALVAMGLLGISLAGLWWVLS
jgi:pSer/pThr/pTyr-binding forkhead associated (FHA) protein